MTAVKLHSWDSIFYICYFLKYNPNKEENNVLFVGYNFKNHLRRQAKLFRRQLADDFQGAFFALTVDAASRTFPVKNTAKL